MHRVQNVQNMVIFSYINTDYVITKKDLSFRKCSYSQNNPKRAAHTCALTATTLLSIQKWHVDNKLHATIPSSYI